MAELMTTISLMVFPYPLRAAVIVAVVLAVPLHALEWTETKQTAVVEAGSDIALATYHFVNTSKAVVNINGIHTDCGCTDATPSASDIPAGGSGTIQVVFTVGKRTGHQHKEILVETSDAKEPVKLVFEVDLPAAKAEAKK